MSVASGRITNTAARKRTTCYTVRNSTRLTEIVCSVEKIRRNASSASSKSRTVCAIGKSTILACFCHRINQKIEARVTVRASSIPIDVVK